MNAYEQFGRAINAMIDANRTSRAAHPERHEFVSVVEYLAESGTVRVGAGRQTGKSYYAASHAGVDDCIIVPNGEMGRSLCALSVPDGVICDVIHADDVLSRGPTKRYSTIYIDEPEFVFRVVPRRQLYAKLSIDPDQTFVLLGN